jgi:hypothetical protein
VALGVELGAIEKSWPVPARVTIWGLPVALSVMESVPDLTPPAVGSKKTPMLQLAFVATGFRQLLMTAKSPGFAVTAVIVNVPVPVFVTVTLCGNPLVPTYWLGNVSVVGEAFATAESGGGPGVPVPVRTTGWIGLVKLPEIVRLPLFAPVDVGPKYTKTSQDLPGATVPQQNIPGELGDGQPPFPKSPDIEICAIVSVLVPVFVIVTL